MRFFSLITFFTILSTYSFAQGTPNDPALPIFLNHLQELKWSRGPGGTSPAPLGTVASKLASVLTADNLRLIENDCVTQADNKSKMCTISFDSTANGSQNRVEVIYNFRFEAVDEVPTGYVAYSVVTPNN
jgi:hypothetical protein